MVTKKKQEPGRLYLNQSEIILLNDFMRTICSSTEVNGKRIAEYKSPWTDMLVVNELRSKIAHIAMSHVQGFRERIFGNLIRGSGPHTYSKQQLADRLQKLEEWARSCGFEGETKT